MTTLIAWTNNAFESKLLHPLVIIAVFVVTLLAIHPFQEDNERLSRLLTTLLLLKSGYGYLPYASLESVVESTKERYYVALRRTQTTIWTKAPNWTPWLESFIGALAEQKTRLERKIHRERPLLGDLPELSMKILELCKEHGRATVGEIARVTGTKRNTIKDHIAALTKNQHLTRHGAGRGVWYSFT